MTQALLGSWGRGNTFVDDTLLAIAGTAPERIVTFSAVLPFFGAP